MVLPPLLHLTARDAPATPPQASLGRDLGLVPEVP
jgi:hypothetical protein